MGVHGPDGRFAGPRIQVEAVPRLPTFPARWTLEDPGSRPYFVFWTTPEGELEYHVQMARLGDGAIRLSTPDGRSCCIGVLRRPLPRRGGTFLLYRCPRCGTPRRYLYGLGFMGGRVVEDGVWRCHRCAGLLFVSQGRYRSRFELTVFSAFYGDARVREPLPRRPWDPRAVSHPRMVVGEFPEVLMRATDHARDAGAGCAEGLSERPRAHWEPTRHVAQLRVGSLASPQRAHGSIRCCVAFRTAIIRSR